MAQTPRYPNFWRIGHTVNDPQLKLEDRYMTPSLRLPSTFVAAAAALTLVTGAAVAAENIGYTAAAKTAGAPVTTGDALGKSIGEIAMSLEQRGYEIHEIGSDDGLVEAEVLYRQEVEIYVDPSTGTVVEIERDD